MPEMQIHNVENKALFMGDNEFEYGLLTVPASTAIPAGALLKRTADGKFAPVANTDPVQIDVGDEAPKTVAIPGVPADIPVAVNPAQVKNTAEAPADISFRALISGKVRRDMLSIGGQPITDAQGDMLRAYGIIARAVYDTSRLDNQ
jgi:hypothetical protein